jgi:hypothetical protein
MASAINPFRLLSEFIVFLLGALLIVLAFSGRVGLPTRPAALIALGAFFVYWGVRAGIKPELGVAAVRVENSRDLTGSRWFFHSRHADGSATARAVDVGRGRRDSGVSRIAGRGVFVASKLTSRASEKSDK